MKVCGLVRVDLFLDDLNLVFHCFVILNFSLHLLDTVDNCGMIPTAQKGSDGILRGAGHGFCQIHCDQEGGG